MNKTNNTPVSYREAALSDASEIMLLFREHISENTEYISHGEMQMGITVKNGYPTPDSYAKWFKYLCDRIEDEQSAVILVSNPYAIMGFAVVQVCEDGDAPFGVLNDILVHEADRRQGYGKSLYTKAVEWLAGRGVKDCYLESGYGNHYAHEFFARQGFRLVSHTFHKDINQSSGVHSPE